MLDDADRDRPNLTEQEQQLFEFVRAGKVDAEIAVRLGISNAEAKARLEQLAWKLRAANRDELRNATDPPEARSQARALAASPDATAALRRWKLTSALLAVLVVSLSGLLLASQLYGDDKIPAQALDQTGAAAPTITLTPAATVAATNVSGRKMYDAGQLFVARSNVVSFSVSTRESLMVVSLGQAAVIRYRDSPADWRVSGAGPRQLDLSGQVGPNGVRLFLLAQGETQFLFGDDDSVGVYSTDEAGPSLIIWAQAPDGPAYYHAELLPDGHLYIETDSIPANAAVAYDTGELLDVSGMLPVGQVGREDHWTYCATDIWDDYASHSCSALIRGADVVPTGAGTLTCMEGERKEVHFKGAFGVLQLRAENRSSFHCGPPGGVAPNQPLGYPGLWSVVASAPDGSPLSVVVTRNGTVYVGELTAKFDCPCRSGN